MQAFAVALSLAFCVPRVFGQMEPTGFNTTFDNASIKIADTVCANTPTLAQYTTWGDIPTFSQFHGLAGAASVGAWPNVLCGQCILLEYIHDGVLRAGYVVLVDVTTDMWPGISWEKAHVLTGLTQAEYLGQTIIMEQIAANKSYCGLGRTAHPSSDPTEKRQAKREQVIRRQSRKDRRQVFKERIGRMVNELEEVM